MSIRIRGSWLAVVGAATLIIGAVAMPRAAHAATFTVNSTLDEVDAAPGDGVCASTPSGKCTLRAAIQEANAFAGADKVVLGAKTYTLSIAGAEEDAAATGDLDVTASVTIAGQGAGKTLVNGAGLDRVFDLHGGIAFPTIVIQGLTVANGYAALGGGGGIRASESSTVKISACTVRNSSTGYGTNGNDNDGGGILNLRTQMTVASSTVLQNSAGGGGGIYSYQGTLALSAVKVMNNMATGGAGGVFSDDYAVKIVDSSISNNSVIRDDNNVTAGGLGLYVLSTTPAVVKNTRIVNNQVGSLKGGSDYSYAGGVSVVTGYASATFSGCTITGNAVKGAKMSVGGGVFVAAHHPVVFKNGCVISKNIAGTAGGGIAGGIANVTISGDSTVAGNIPDNVLSW